MKLLGVVLAVFGWALPVMALSWTSSTGVRLVLCVIGILISLTGILGVLNKAHQKDVIWKR